MHTPNKEGERYYCSPEQLPELESYSFLAEWLRDLGYYGSSGFGAEPISWSEMRAWSELTGHDLTPFEAETLRLMSESYVAEAIKFTKEAAPPPPWLPEGSDYHKQLNDRLKSGLASMARKKRRG